MQKNQEVVNGLWIGEELSLIELLTIASFLKQGHPFVLWTYSDIKTALPVGVELKNAAEIIPKDKVFAYKNKNQYGHGKGSFSGFSDIFRYKLLYDCGGWWVDMDVCCLKALPQSSEYYFRKHHDLPMVGNVMKCPRGSEVMRLAYENAIENVDENNTDWHKPIEILNRFIAECKLHDFIFDGHSNRDWLADVIPFFFKRKIIPRNWYFIHWTNENFRSKNWDKNNFKYGSTFGRLLKEHGLLNNYPNRWKRTIHDVKFVLSQAKNLKRI